MRLVRTAVALLAALSLAACGGSATKVVAGSSTLETVTPSTSSAPSSPIASATPSVTPTAAPTTLPESVLPTLPGYTYTTSGVSDDELLAQMSARMGDQKGDLNGVLQRALVRNNIIVGGVTILRPTTTPTPKEASQGALDSVAGFAGATQAKSVTIAGQKSWQATRPGKQPLTGIAWPDGTDFILVFAGSVRDAQVIAAAYIKAARG